MEQNWVFNFGWVKAHTGNEGNELADHLAKEAAEDEGVLYSVYDKTTLITVAADLKMKDSQSGRDNGKAPTKERCAGRFSQQ